jgi:hypothetical protein
MVWPLLPSLQWVGERENDHPAEVFSIDTAATSFKSLRANVDCWDRLGGGCEFRAEAAARYLHASGVAAAKVWALLPVRAAGMKTRPLTPRRQKWEFAEGRKFWTWDFHVAAITVLRRDDGIVVPIVFDPTLTDGPCSPDRWLWAMDLPDARSFATSRTVFEIDLNSLAFVPFPGEDIYEAGLARCIGVRDTDVAPLPALL